MAGYLFLTTGKSQFEIYFVQCNECRALRQWGAEQRLARTLPGFVTKKSVNICPLPEAYEHTIL